MPARTRLNDFNCALARTLDVVGDWWTLLIIRDAIMGIDRFGGFQTSLGLAKNILSDRLGRLITAGMMDRTPDGAYRLTEKGQDLLPAIAALTQWGDRHAFDGAPPVEMTDEHGQPIDAIRLTSGRSREVSARALRFLPGPSATERTRAFLRYGGPRSEGRKR